MRNVFLLAIVLMSALAGTAGAQPPGAATTKLRVEVKNIDGRPVDRASVLVRFVQGGHNPVKLVKKMKTSWELRTNQEGVVKIPPIPQGQILVQVMAKNYQTFGQTFEINEQEKTLEVQLKPPQSQYSAHQ
jgi:hypothetical protein